jgi:hypothetical protein
VITVALELINKGLLREIQQDWHSFFVAKHRAGIDFD